MNVVHGPAGSLFCVQLSVAGEYNTKRLNVVAFDGDAAVAAARDAACAPTRLLTVEFIGRVDVVAPAVTDSGTGARPSTSPCEPAQATRAGGAEFASSHERRGIPDMIMEKTTV